MSREVQKLRNLAQKARGEEWFVEHAATDDGLSRIDDGCQHGMFPIYGEAHEIEFAAACVNYVRRHVVPLSCSEIEEQSWRESGERERARAACRPATPDTGGAARSEGGEASTEGRQHG